MVDNLTANRKSFGSTSIVRGWVWVAVSIVSGGVWVAVSIIWGGDWAAGNIVRGGFERRYH